MVCLKVFLFRWLIFFSLLWVWNVLLVLWCVMMFCVSVELRLEMCVSRVVEVVLMLMLMVFM